jgi:large subunit ribosomal protein L25
VRLDEAIEAVVPLELTGAEDAPGVKEGGVLEQITRELNVRALPTAIPESIVHDIGAMQIGETIVLQALAAPESVELVDDPDTVLATLSPPRLQTEEEEIESETELVGEGEAGEQAAEAADGAGSEGASGGE